ncbi:long-chain fatty acid--CoA ligase [Flammeovirga pectinis]|uniref:Long-chain fatty acid--CoA ligase n=1 Tax=Flammeovirga pectinis TaxID=2494373 RepID=A0A3Q9FNS8_9BACT|nr:class I adenylate-forming enzyme family protein [Flammeovirga pectinis]AZQ61910.1 long-chain fatty acid--CoA ligase [Flammeovirga pectinis]
MNLIISKGEKLSFDNLLNIIECQKECQSIIVFSSSVEFYSKLIVNFINDINTIIVDNSTIINEQNLEVRICENIFYGQKNIKNIKGLVKSSDSSIGLFTSGTTGKPKLIEHKVSKFFHAVRKQNSRNDVWALLYNPSHVAGLQVFFQAYLNDILLVDLYKSSKVEFIKASQNYNITHISATPTYYKLLAPYDFYLKNIKRCTLGGEKSNMNLVNNLKKVFPNAKINNIYASTEAGSLFISKNDTFKILEEVKSKVKFINNEIVLHHSIIGNFNKEEWFYTGDIVEFTNNKETEFKIVSRNNEIINIGGIRVNLLEVEEKILNFDFVKQTRVYKKENSVLGYILCCDLILNQIIKKSDIKKIFRTKLLEQEIPIKINIVEEITLTNSGKIKRN